MVKPKQRVILYTKGLRAKTSAQYNNERRLRQEGFAQCPLCKRAIRETPNGKLVNHFADFPNRIHCRNGTERQNDGGAAKRRGVKRGPYKPRQTKRVVD